MEEKNKSPELRFAGFKEGWEEKKFEKIFIGIRNNSLSRDKLNYKYGQAKNIHYGDILVKFGEIVDVQKQQLPFITSSEDAENLRGSQLINGDIILADAAEDEIVGKCIEVQNINTEVIHSGLHTIAVRPLQKFAPKYLGYYMNSSSYHDQLIRLMQGTKVLSISKTAIQDTHIRFPSNEEEQGKISKYITEIDELITKHQKKHNHLVTLKKSMLEKMFPKESQTVPEIRFKGFEGNWESDELNNFGNTYTGLSGKTKKDFGHGDAKYITYMNVFSNPIANPSLTDSVEIDNSQNCVDYGDVLFTVSSETPEEVGFSSVWTQKEKNIYLNSFCFGYRPTKRFDLTFLANAFRSNAFRKKITLLAQGISRFNISKTKAMNLELSFPDYDEQVKIGLYFKDLEGLVSSHKKQLEKLNNFKHSFSEKMFV